MEDPNEDEDLIPTNERRPQRLLDSRRQADGELSDSDDEGEDNRRNHASHKNPDSVAHSTGRRAAVGIMSTGSTHGIGTSAATAVAGTSNSGAGSSVHSDMDTNDDGPAVNRSPFRETMVPRSPADASRAKAAQSSAAASSTQPRPDDAMDVEESPALESLPNKKQPSPIPAESTKPPEASKPNEDS
ncbi:histone deacetylase [Steccherinum ochraceum]|uniref:Histone deacetylase n=1 Tax=Steccherinum ochraceum TaxID=92696 RepID=A0A4R0RQN8_9APHY|nr:histone deacetylase [Steccherinum ochraceum]